MCQIINTHYPSNWGYSEIKKFKILVGGRGTGEQQIKRYMSKT